MVRRASKAGRTGLNGMPSGCKLDVFQAGDQPAMRIAPGVIEPLFKQANRLFPQDVLDSLGIFMDVISCDMRGVRQIELPQTVIPDDLAGTLPTLGSEDRRAAIA